MCSTNVNDNFCIYALSSSTWKREPKALLVQMEEHVNCICRNTPYKTCSKTHYVYSACSNCARFKANCF